MRVALIALGAAAISASHSAQLKWEPLSSAQQQPPAATEPAEPRHNALSVARPGKIVMYRGSSIMGAGIACPIRYKGDEVVELARGKYAEWSVPPGRYILTNHTSSVEVAVDPGETRYVRCMIKTGMLTGRADLQIVDEESFNEHRSEYQQKQIESVMALPAR